MRYCPEELLLKERCTGCGVCSEVCPTGAVTILDQAIPAFDASVCIECGHCGAFCPENAFGLEPFDPAGMTGPAGFRKMLEARRSVRCFRHNSPGEDEIGKLLSVLDQCPTGRNAQGLLVRVASGEGVPERFSRPLVRLAGILSRTGLLQLAGALTGTGRMLARLAGGEDVVFRGAPVILFFFVPRKNPTGRADGIIAAATVMHHATSMGMGTLWNGVAERLYPFVRSWHRPETAGMRLTAVLCAGYPGREPLGTVPGRDCRILFEGSEDD